MWDGCTEIVLGFDTKDGCVVVGARLLDGWGNISALCRRTNRGGFAASTARCRRYKTLSDFIPNTPAAHPLL